jgi:hypothetical protein
VPVMRRRSGEHYFKDVSFTGKRAKTIIGITHGPGPAEPWIIAMSEKSRYLSTLDCANRWGIELMFSDFKSRGFGIEQTQIQYPDRLGSLILVMALPLYEAVSIGMWDAENNPIPAKKNGRTVTPEKLREENSNG